ncbi:MAG: cytochrome c biogenesis CcdA family protein [Bacillota bacterium]
MNDVSFLLAVTAGFLSFLSPCVLPLVPAYISYLTGSSISELQSSKARLLTLYKSIGFVIGFSVIFILMGLSVTSLGNLLIKNKEIFTKISGALIILFGIHISGIFKFKFLYFEKKLLAQKSTGMSSIFIGMAFAAGWTPCIGPILSSILLYAGNMDTIHKGVLLLAAYSLGLAVPFLITALAIGSFIKYFRSITKYMPVISFISGLLLVIVGILILTDNFSMLSRYFNFIAPY